MRGIYRDFFLPSEALTRAIMAALISLAKSEAMEDIDEEKLMAEERVSEELLAPPTTALSGSLSEGVEEARMGNASAEDSEVARMQAEISGRLYHYLALLAQPGDGREYNIFEVIPAGMAARLGLPDSKEHLLVALTEEFDNWLARRGYFRTGWGEIYLHKNRRSMQLVDRVKPIRAIEPAQSDWPAVAAPRARR